jgi:hypothetical protein
MEYTVNEVNEDEMFIKEAEKWLIPALIDKKFPFAIMGKTPMTDGEVEELTVAGQPLKDYQIKNIIHAISNETIGYDVDPKHEQQAEQTLYKIIEYLMKRMAESKPELGELTMGYHKSSFNPKSLSNPNKKTPRFIADDE